MSFTHTLLRIFFLFVVVFVFNTQLTFAAKFVTSGASGATISWNVAGGSGSCTADSDYPFAADDIRADWNGSTRSSVSSWGTPTILAAPASDTAYTFSCTDWSVPTGDSDTLTVCGTGRYATSDSGPCAAIVYGSCSATHYNCSAGTAANQTSISNGYTWNCNGAPNDVSHRDSCYECTGGTVWDGNSCEFVETYASCGGSAYTCSAGNYAGDGYLSSGTYYWTCNGYPNDAPHRASCNVACSPSPTVTGIAYRNSGGTIVSNFTNGETAYVTWSTSGAGLNGNMCTWQNYHNGVLNTYTNPGLGWPVPNPFPGWSYGIDSTYDGDYWTFQCTNSCGVTSGPVSTGAITVGPAPCSARGAETWLTNCGVASVPGVASGSSSIVSNTNVGYTGSATWSCSDGSWSGPTNTSCTANPCSALGAQTWLTNCGVASVPGVASGNDSVVLNTNAGYTGEATWSCSAGSWSGPSNAWCVQEPECSSGSGSHTNPCIVGTVSWTTQNPVYPARTWEWSCEVASTTPCNSSEVGYWLTTSITSGGAGGSITPGTTLYSAGDSVSTTINVPTYVIPPTGASWAIQSKTVDGVTTNVNGTTPVPAGDSFTMNADHSVSAVLYQPDPITTTVTQNPSVYLGDSATVKWTTDGNRCNLYNWNGTVLIKAIGAVPSAPTENSVTLTSAELPQTVNAFAYIMRCDDSTDINRGLYDANVTITLLCPRDPESYNQVTVSTCNNPVPVVGIAPGNQTIVLGQSAVYTSVVTDGTNDIVAHEMEWQKPNGTWSWQAPPNGSVAYAPGDETLFPGSPKNSNSITATFTPTQDGVYFIRFVAMDDTLNNPALSYISNPNPRYYTSGGRLTYSGSYRLTVTTRVGANIQPDTGGKLRWTCFNADYASVVGSMDDFATQSSVPLSYRSLPPSTGTFTPTPGEAYRLLCETTLDSATFTYYPPSLTENSVTSTTADIAYNCNAPSAQSASIQRISGMAPTSYSAIANPSFVDNGLDPQTDYTYVLRCYDGPLVGGVVSGNQIGYASLDIHTTNAIVDLNPIVISSYIRGKAGDPVGLTNATTTDGAFFEWVYTITSGTPTSCTMQQRNDNGSWYPAPGYDTNTMAYTMPWSSLLSADKQAFVNSYQTKHDWKISCVNPLGTITTKTWTLTKVQPSIAVIDSITEGTLPVIADVVFRCVPASARYTIKDSNDVGVPGHTNQVYGGPVTFSPTAPGNYKITCDDGPATIVLISATMWDPFVRLSGTQRTAGGATSVTLTWDISNPDATCRIWADVTIPPSCDATCLANRQAASTTINTILQTGNTDTNDPYWPNGQGSRTITFALTEPAYNTPNARGRVTINNIKYGTTFTAQCTGSAPSKVRVGVTTTNEG